MASRGLPLNVRVLICVEPICQPSPHGLVASSYSLRCDFLCLYGQVTVEEVHSSADCRRVFFLRVERLEVKPVSVPSSIACRCIFFRCMEMHQPQHSCRPCREPTSKKKRCMIPQYEIPRCECDLLHRTTRRLLSLQWACVRPCGCNLLLLIIMSQDEILASMLMSLRDTVSHSPATTNLSRRQVPC